METLLKERTNGARITEVIGIQDIFCQWVGEHVFMKILM